MESFRPSETFVAPSSATAVVPLHEGTQGEEEPITRQRVKLQLALPEAMMNGLIYLVGLVVVIMFILSFLGLR